MSRRAILAVFLGGMASDDFKKPGSPMRCRSPPAGKRACRQGTAGSGRLATPAVLFPGRARAPACRRSRMYGGTWASGRGCPVAGWMGATCEFVRGPAVADKAPANWFRFPAPGGHALIRHAVSRPLRGARGPGRAVDRGSLKRGGRWSLWELVCHLPGARGL
jgi:hypothetical protein